MSYKGKAPYSYDKNSKSWREGAFKNWPNSTPERTINLAIADRKFLSEARRHRSGRQNFVGQ